MEVSKIHLSMAESEMMQNAEIILTKNRVLEKIKKMLGEVQQKQLDYQRMNLQQHEAFFVPPKISRGENYLGLPWLILDYPRTSSGNDLFFIRTMFWWGRFFSSTLHVSGIYKEMFSYHIRNMFPLLSHLSIGINADPWIHHFGNDNYQCVGTLNEQEFEGIQAKLPHLKLGITLPLHQWP